jgi:hypothetical protein
MGEGCDVIAQMFTASGKSSVLSNAGSHPWMSPEKPDTTPRIRKSPEAFRMKFESSCKRIELLRTTVDHVYSFLYHFPLPMHNCSCHAFHSDHDAGVLDKPRSLHHLLRGGVDLRQTLLVGDALYRLRLDVRDLSGGLLWFLNILHERERKDLSDGVIVGQEHTQPFDPKPPATCWRKAVLKGLTKCLVDS